MNRRNFIKTTGAIAVGIGISPTLVAANTLNRTSTFIPIDENLIIIPSEYLMDKYGLRLTPMPSVRILLDKPFCGNNDGWTVVQAVKAPLRFSTSKNITEEHIEKMLVYAVEHRKMKTIYVLIVNRGICLNGDKGCVACTDHFNAFVRGSQQEMYCPDYTYNKSLEIINSVYL